MSKELFIRVMEQIKLLHEEEEKFNTLLHEIDPEFGGGYIHNKTISLLSDIARELIGDKYDYIGYFLWELDFGKGYYEGVITDEKGTPVALSTPEDLYNLIVDAE